MGSFILDRLFIFAGKQKPGLNCSMLVELLKCKAWWWEEHGFSFAFISTTVLWTSLHLPFTEDNSHTDLANESQDVVGKEQGSFSRWFWSTMSVCSCLDCTPQRWGFKRLERLCLCSRLKCPGWNIWSESVAVSEQVVSLIPELITV